MQARAAIAVFREIGLCCRCCESHKWQTLLIRLTKLSSMYHRRQEHEKQVQHLQQQLKAAEEEHCSMQERLEASIQAAAAKEAEAAAAAKAEQAALKAAAEAKQRQQSSAAAAAVAGAQPHLSSPGFQPLALPQEHPQQPLQLPKQQVWQEFEGQRLLSTAAATTAAQPSAAAQRFGWTDAGRGHTASRTCISPMRDPSPTYASRMRDMQDHIDALNRSLSANRQRSSPKRRHVHKGSKHANKADADKRGVHEQSKRARSTSPHGRGQGTQAGVLDLFDSDLESVEEAETNSSRDADSAASSDRCAPLCSIVENGCDNTIGGKLYGICT